MHDIGVAVSSRIIERENPGAFVRKFYSYPGFINGCSYRIDFAEGCPLNCKYCFLNDYLDDPALVTLYSNHEKIRSELNDKHDTLRSHAVSLGVLNDSFYPKEVKARVLELSLIHISEPTRPY